MSLKNISKKKLLSATATLTILFATSAPSLANNVEQIAPEYTPQNIGVISKDSTILEGLSAANTLKQVEAAVKSTELANLLSQSTSYTIFAPRDSAFWKVSNDTYQELMSPSGTPELTSLLKAHTIEGSVNYTALEQKIQSSTTGSASKQTLSGDTLTFKIDGKYITVTDKYGASAVITRPNIEQKNGFIHVINQVLTTEAEITLTASS